MTLNIHLYSQKLSLIEGSDLRKVITAFPFPFHMKVYFFNVSNPDAVENGEKPIIEEIRPFVYE